MWWTSPTKPAMELDNLSCGEMHKVYNHRQRCEGETSICPDDHGSHSLLIIMFCPAHHDGKRTEELEYQIELNETVFKNMRVLENDTLPFNFADLNFSDLFGIAGSEVYLTTGESDTMDNYIKEMTLKYYIRFGEPALIGTSIGIFSAFLIVFIFGLIFIVSVCRLQQPQH